jgi:hypothetical protein
MSDDRPTRETMSIEEATVSNMWEIAAIVELLEQKGLCTKQDLYDIITEVRRKNPRARIPETAFPEPYVLTETENKVNDDILELLNKHGLTSHQCKSLGRSARTQFSLYPRPFKLVFRAARQVYSSACRTLAASATQCKVSSAPHVVSDSIALDVAFS